MREDEDCLENVRLGKLLAIYMYKGGRKFRRLYETRRLLFDTLALDETRLGRGVSLCETHGIATSNAHRVKS